MNTSATLSTRRTFLSSLAVAAVAPAAIGCAITVPSGIEQTYKFFCLWGRQCGMKNPAWVMYDMMVAKYGVDAVDRESAVRMAAFCDEPVEKAFL